MKIKGKYLLREIAGENIAVPINETTADANVIIALNSSGAFIWQKLYEGIGKDELVKSVTDEYEIDSETAEKDIDLFINYLKENNVEFE